jgi:hypothetical protein
MNAEKGEKVEEEEEMIYSPGSSGCRRRAREAGSGVCGQSGKSIDVDP